jgi:hypothetical protein
LTMIGSEVSKMLNRPVTIVPTQELFLFMTDQLRYKTSPGYDVPDLLQQTLNDVNDIILKHEIPIHYNSLRRRELYFKWFVFNDRQRVLPPPEFTNGRRCDNSLKGVNTYVMNHPRNKSWNQFRSEQLAHNVRNTRGFYQGTAYQTPLP